MQAIHPCKFPEAVVQTLQFLLRFGFIRSFEPDPQQVVRESLLKSVTAAGFAHSCNRHCFGSWMAALASCAEQSWGPNASSQTVGDIGHAGPLQPSASGTDFLDPPEASPSSVVAV